MDRTQIYLAREQRLRLGALARAQGKAMADLIREAIDRYLAQQKSTPQPRSSSKGLVGVLAGMDSASTVSERHHRYLRTRRKAGKR